MSRAAVSTLPTEIACNEAWEFYAALVRKQQADPKLWLERTHCEAVALAWRSWRDAFLKFVEAQC